MNPLSELLKLPIQLILKLKDLLRVGGSVALVLHLEEVILKIVLILLEEQVSQIIKGILELIAS